MFKKIAVIGAGTMGSGIAGQIANAGHQVLLLDLPGKDSRNGVTERALQRLLKSDPPALHHKRIASSIQIGNTEDDFDLLASMDWVVEAVVERLEIKKELYHKLNKVIPAHCVVTSNTSTIPISLLVEDMPVEFRQRFAITHYFNPVRYMRLLELVSGENTDRKILDELADFNDRELGKGVVRCGDTPGFLGNRVGVFALQVGIDEAKRNQLPIESADALMGRPMGIPKTGVFGLYDLIGIDLMADVVRSLRGILPDNDAFHAVGAESDMINAMVKEGLTGEKGGGGFYKTVNGQRLAKDLDSGVYRDAQVEQPDRAQQAAKAIINQEEPLHSLIEGNHAEAAFCRNVLGRVLGYAAGLLGEVTDTPQAIDDAMKLGFNWIRGPFEMIDAIGSDKVASMLAATGAKVPECLQGTEPFYKTGEAKLTVRHSNGSFKPVSLPDEVVRFHLTRQTLTPIATNRAASLFVVEDDLRLIEFHSKANALTDESMDIVLAAANNPGKGIIVHNDAQHYSAGVDLNAFLGFIDNGNWSGIDLFLQQFQEAVKALKYCDAPVVGAPSGLALGGGFEILLHCDELVVHSNSVLGLVEAAVGLVPGGGGVKETYLRWYEQTADWEQAAWNTWMNIGYGATGSSPIQAGKLNYYRDGIDQSVMNRDRLYHDAVLTVMKLGNNYKARSFPDTKLASGALKSKMATFMDDGIKRGDFYPHDKTVAMQIATIVTNDTDQQVMVSEDDLYARERAAFVRLAKTPETRARIHHMLFEEGGLRN